MIKNYIFDFGNVIAEFSPEKLSSPYCDNSEMLKAVSDVAFDRKYWDKLDKGEISDDEIKADIFKRLSGKYAEAACLAYDGWIANLTPVNGMSEIIYDLKSKGAKLYLLSNISAGFAESYHNIKWIRDVFSNFDGLVFSGKIKLVKPQKDIFEYILRKYGLESEECIFIDDNINNIDGAGSIGIKGYLFDGNCGKFREFLGI